jgi:Na+/H+ antiporter NhaD/arsenite permease-like protein
MDLAAISLAALVVVVVATCTTRPNPGVLAVVLAWVIGVYLAPRWGTETGLRGVVAGFPSELFLTLLGVTLLFRQAQVNGTLDQLARAAVRCCRGEAGLMPVMFFLLTFAFAAAGAGNIGAAALMASLALAAAARARIPALLMTIMVAHGSLAGARSPFAPTGSIANNLLRKELGVTGFAWPTYGHNLLADTVVAFAGYPAFGGWRLFARHHDEKAALPGARPEDRAADAEATKAGLTAGETGQHFRPRHGITLAVIALLIAGVRLFGVHVGVAAFAGAVALTLLRLSDGGRRCGRCLGVSLVPTAGGPSRTPPA